MNPSRSQTTADPPPDAAGPSPDGAGLVWTRIAQGAAMAAVVAVGVTALSLFPHPRPAGPPAVRVAVAPAAAPVAAPAPPVTAPPQLRPRIAPPTVPQRAAVMARESRPRAP